MERSISRIIFHLSSCYFYFNLMVVRKHTLQDFGSWKSVECTIWSRLLSILVSVLRMLVRSRLQLVLLSSSLHFLFFYLVCFQLEQCRRPQCGLVVLLPVLPVSTEHTWQPFGSFIFGIAVSLWIDSVIPCNVSF